jgi:tetratricopeptide (TPR) repeat protein
MKRTFAAAVILSALFVLGSIVSSVAAEDPLRANVVEIDKAYLGGTLPEMIEKYEGLVKETPSDASLHYLLGVTYLYADFNKADATFDKAFAEFSRAQNLDSKMKYVNTSLAYIFWARGEYDKAIESYKAEIALDPNDGWNYYNLGQAYEGLKQWDKALSQYIIAIDKVKDDPRIAKAYNNLGAIYLDWKGDYFKALDNFKRAMELKPNERRYKENYNKTIRKLKELKEALDKGETELPPEMVEKLKKMELKEVEIEKTGT